MNTKSQALIALAIISIADGVTSQYPDSSHPSQWATMLLVVLFALATFAWYRADAIERSYRRSILLDVAVFGLAAIALPYYFFRSRGMRQGLLATLAALGIFVASAVLTVLTAYILAVTVPM